MPRHFGQPGFRAVHLPKPFHMRVGRESNRLLERIPRKRREAYRALPARNASRIGQLS